MTEHDPANPKVGGDEHVEPLDCGGGSRQPQPDDAAPRGGQIRPIVANLWRRGFGTSCHVPYSHSLTAMCAEGGVEG
jgi:hypothetical protein